MSSADRAYGLLKSVMLMGERFDAIDIKIRDLAVELGALARSHSELAQRVARIEGMFEGAAMAARSNQPRIER